MPGESGFKRTADRLGERGIGCGTDASACLIETLGLGNCLTKDLADSLLLRIAGGLASWNGGDVWHFQKTLCPAATLIALLDLYDDFLLYS